MNPVNIYRFVRFFVAIGIVVLGGVALFYLSTYTYPFIIAIFIAFFMNPLVDFFEKKARMPRGLAVLVSLLLILSIFAGLITLLVVEIVSGADYLGEVVPKHLVTVVDYIEDLIVKQILPLYNQTAALFKNLDTGQQDTILDNIQNIGQTIATTAGNFIQSFFQNIPGIIGWIPNTATVLVFSALATFFISKDWYRLSNLSNKLLPDKVYVSTVRIIKDLKRALFGFIKAQFTLVSITTVTVLIGLLFLKVRYSITIALICGLVDIVPYLGTGTIFIPWIIYEFISGNTSLGIGLSVLYTIVIVQRQLIEPKVLSSSIGLDPLATLVALFVGYKMIGILGLIAGPVTLVIINTLQRANIFKDIWSFIIGKEGRRDNL
ncbi:sporulation integral membrane protein YtvI [Peribacillus psychrosaccharolyticus]|uniref:Sporulation integral membrane protein YtvI n=1 Tax=Peribacillus psychrosaccharolyticus TaxID=1407 RepID=A0A974S0T6_PERPY|nr:sporulation integral membrane protein YtvI [Peribacillus psychrosaccharolyticus]MEC2054693.1 sporulation integral membrane protein YtvI [Peribacillus psychrosaccharolyticus]MED3744080.1 sporulation integral membrane protein YtvI [Peribacillus psychrosaccharolyticus]QQS99574.1 sporulation integral membrane protein YtvI [Peribacillus psychrosaccharolyticus]